MRTREYERLLPRYSAVIEAIATKMSRKYPHFRDDLIQEGHLRLARMTLTRAGKRKLDPYIRAAIKHAMIDHLRKLKLDRVDCSIDEAFRRGFRMTRDNYGLRLEWGREGWPANCEMFL